MAMARPTVCIFSLTPVTDEPRVLRQSRALAERGWDVIVAGFRGRQPAPSDWRFIEVAHLANTKSEMDQIRDAAELALSRFSSAVAERHYWRQAGYEGIREHVAYVEDVRCDFVIAHDYFTAPLAAYLAKKNGCKFSVDVHEYSRGQYMHDPKWRTVIRPWVHAMEKRFLPKAAVVTTVCDGIADLLHRECGLKKRPTVVRSTPFYQELPFRETNPARIDVLYHGILAQMRGLEETIASVPQWRSEFRFIIRGPGPEDYIQSLKALAEQHGVADRVVVDPPVAAATMVAEANKADVGFFVQPDISPQKRFTLPNKFFEYIMAGTALCVADLPEMARIVRQYGNGVLVPGVTPDAIAATVNKLTAEEIDRYKKKSLETARILSWENESQVMYDAYVAAGVVPSGASAGETGARRTG